MDVAWNLINEPSSTFYPQKSKFFLRRSYSETLFIHKLNSSINIIISKWHYILRSSNQKIVSYNSSLFLDHEIAQKNLEIMILT